MKTIVRDLKLAIGVSVVSNDDRADIVDRRSLCIESRDILAVHGWSGDKCGTVGDSSRPIDTLRALDHFEQMAMDDMQMTYVDSEQNIYDVQLFDPVIDSGALLCDNRIFIG